MKCKQEGGVEDAGLDRCVCERLMAMSVNVVVWMTEVESLGGHLDTPIRTKFRMLMLAID